MLDEIAVEKHWIRTGATSWQLLVDIGGRILTKTIIIYDTTGDYEHLLALNKVIKEHDIIEQAWKLYKVRIRLVDNET